MIGKFWPLTALILELACVCLWGCEYFDMGPKLVESGSTKDGSFVMVSDTTALLAVHYYERYEWSSGADREDCTKMGMRLVDTRGTEYNYWEGLIDSCAGLKIEPLSDSTVLFLGRDGNEWLEYYVWKIKENPVLKKAKWVNGRLPVTLNAPMRVWKNGKYLFKHYDEFALLDTAANTITQITKEEAGWPDGVEDAQYFKDDLMTLNFISENHCEFGFMKNLRDTVAVHREDSCGYVHTRLQLNGWFVNRENFDQSNKSDCIFSTDSNWQISEKPVAKYYVQYFKSLDRE